MAVWNKRTGETIDQEEVDLAREIWGKVTPAVQKRMADAAPQPVKGPPPLPTRALAPKGRFGLPTLMECKS